MAEDGSERGRIKIQVIQIDAKTEDMVLGEFWVASVPRIGETFIFHRPSGPDRVDNVQLVVKSVVHQAVRSNEDRIASIAIQVAQR